VQLLVLTSRPELETNRRLEQAADALGLRAATLDATRVTAIRLPEPALRWGSEDLLVQPPPAVLARVGNWRPESVLAALEVAVSSGSSTVNPAAAIRVGRDHWLTVHALAEAGVPVPMTVAGSDPDDLAAIAADVVGFPAVVKQRRSRMGVGVVRCLGRDHLEAVLDTLWRLGDEVVVQSWVGSGGSSLRLMVVGDEVVAAARLVAGVGEWRSNAARGGRAEAHSPTAEESCVARAAARAVGLGVCGVDLIPGDPPMVIEVNPTPGFRHLEAATAVDVAGAIVGYVAAALL
jgi:RimK family alpha-L-glutamate ligase